MFSENFLVIIHFVIDVKYCKKNILNFTSTLAELDAAYACDLFEDS